MNLLLVRLAHLKCVSQISRMAQIILPSANFCESLLCGSRSPQGEQICVICVICVTLFYFADFTDFRLTAVKLAFAR